MSDQTDPSDPTDPSDAVDQPRVAEVLDRLRAGVRQRQAELATVTAGTDEARFKLVELTAKEFIQEPMAMSPRPVIGRALVFVRKAMFHLFFKWYMRPVIEQQNAFNQTASRLVQDLVQSQERLARQLREIEARLAHLEKAEKAETRD
jgi:hypothetical protein